ncbi:MAG TPA: calcium-binding protein, partial [Thermomicrobiales bacterium]|nr:calcium-binding protein [Thermomicrobiales bacterium]
GDTYTSIEGLIGSAFNDTLIGDSGNNDLRGGLGADHLDGGAGNDYADYRGNTNGVPDGAVTADLADPTQNTGSAAGDTYVSIEGLIGSAFNDTLIGDSGINVLRGGLGADRLEGGGGLDFADYRGSTNGIPDGAVTANLADPTQNTGSAAGDTYVSIEGLIGSNLNDTLIGDAGNNSLRGGLGADHLDGGAGFDFAEYFNSTEGLTVNLATPANNTGEASGDTFTSIEGILGSQFNDTLVGDAGDNVLIGAGGGDVLNGGPGGTDTASYQYGSVSRGVTASLAAPGINTGDAAGDTYVSIENLQGTGFADHLVGDAGANTLIGLGGNDVLDGLGGNDTLVGDAGSDTFVYAPGDGADRIVDFTAAGAGHDRVDLTGFTKIRSLDDVLADASQVSADTVLNFGNGDTLTLQGVTKTSLAEDDFLLKANTPNDFNADSMSDLLWQNANGAVSIWEMNGASTISNPTLATNPGLAWH